MSTAAERRLLHAMFDEGDVRALVVPDAAPPYLIDVLPELPELSALIGGGILENVSMDREFNRHAYIDDEGKLKSLPINVCATLLVDTYRPGFRNVDVIAGPAVFLGGTPDGEEASVPQDVIDACTKISGVAPTLAGGSN